MKSGFTSAACGIAAEVPDMDDRHIVNEIIFQQLVNGVVTESSRREYIRIIDAAGGTGL